jgi:hypothetical protein
VLARGICSARARCPVGAAQAGGGLGPELHSQEVVLISHPAWDQECIDKHPDDRDHHPHNCKRQNELGDGDAGAFEIKIVTAE